MVADATVSAGYGGVGEDRMSYRVGSHAVTVGRQFYVFVGDGGVVKNNIFEADDGGIIRHEVVGYFRAQEGDIVVVALRDPGPGLCDPRGDDPRRDDDREPFPHQDCDVRDSYVYYSTQRGLWNANDLALTSLSAPSTIEGFVETGNVADIPPQGQVTAGTFRDGPAGTGVFGSDAVEDLRMGGGEDIVRTEGGDDTAHGGSGDDILRMGPGDDAGRGGPGDDRIGGGAGNDELRGGAGDDRVGGGGGDDQLRLGDGDDEGRGGTGDDRIGGGAGNDELYGGAGDDRVVGGAGIDQVRGGAGNDIVLLASPRSFRDDDPRCISPNPEDPFPGYYCLPRQDRDRRDAEPLDSGRDDQPVQVAWFVPCDVNGTCGGVLWEQAFGGRGDDQLFGTAGGDKLFGGTGNDLLSAGGSDDVLRAGAGDDRLIGGTGVNRMLGGDGADVFHVQDGGRAIVRDFEVGTDRLAIDTELFREGLEAQGARVIAGGEVVAVLRGIDTASLTAADVDLV